MLCARLHIQVEIDLVPGTQNPGDAFSRPLQPEKRLEVLQMLEKYPIVEQPLTFPATVSAKAIDWLTATNVLRQPAPLQREITAALAAMRVTAGPALALALLDAIRPEGAQYVRFGWWPRVVHDSLTACTAWNDALIRLLAHAGRVWAHDIICTSIVVRQGVAGDYGDHMLAVPQLELHVDQHGIMWRRIDDELPTGFRVLSFTSGPATLRRLSVLLGRACGKLPTQRRTALREAGFRLCRPLSCKD